jgi:hypothetical protein
MNTQDLAAIEKAENLLADFLNRSGQADAQLVHTALQILGELTLQYRDTQANLDARLEDFNQLLVEARWQAEPDRMGGQFTQEEINRANQNNWG